MQPIRPGDTEFYKKPKNALDLGGCPADVQAALAEVPDHFVPSRYQYTQWGSWVNWSLGTDPTGWFYGWCPLHDPNREQRISGMFNWKTGALRCMASERCSGKARAISLHSVAVRMGIREEHTRGEG